MIIVKDRGNKINITHRPRTYKINVGGRRGLPGQGVPTGGTAGQILTKDSNIDFDTSWQDPVQGGIETIVSGPGIDVDSTDPVNPEVGLNSASQSSLLLADSALQPGDNVSELVNDAEYTQEDLVIAYAVVL